LAAGADDYPAETGNPATVVQGAQEAINIVPSFTVT
jgi:hypothetical protein